MIGAAICFGLAICIISVVVEIMRAPRMEEHCDGWVSGDERREDGTGTDEEGPHTGGAKDGF